MDETKLLDDILDDLRSERKFLKKLCAFLCAIVVILTVGIVFVMMYSQHKTFEFIEDSEFVSDIDIDNDNSTNYGSIITR